jgi:hypothetical protein
MSKMHKHTDNEIDTKEEIELEKEKWSLTKYKADTIISIARDIVLLLTVIISTIANFIAGNTSKAEFSSLETIAHGEGEGFGSGPRLDVVSSAINSTEPTQFLDAIFNVHTGLGSITVIALIFFILPRVKKMFSKDKK